MNTFHGMQDLNAVLRGETLVQPNDIFLNESEDKRGLALFRFTPNEEALKPSDNFRLLSRATRDTCMAATMEEPAP